jgi:hypothetical protein
MGIVRRVAGPAALVTGGTPLAPPARAAASPSIRRGLEDDPWPLPGPGTVALRPTPPLAVR